MPSRCAQGEWGWVPTYVNTIPHDLFCWLSLGFFERPCQSECLTGVVEILRRSPIRAGMGVLRDIALALYATYQSCKTRGIHCRSLLGLLLEIDAGRYLEVLARKNVETEVTSYSQVGSHFYSPLGTFTWIISRLYVPQVARQGHVPRKFPKS